MDKNLLKQITNILGYVSIPMSIYIWFIVGNENAAIFVGLWAPTLFILSERFSR